MAAFAIKPLTASPQTLDALADILVETVAAGGSVHFLHPLAFADARGFWEKALAAAARGERIVLGAYDGETLVSTVSLLLDNAAQPAAPALEIGKMMTHRESSRPRRGGGCCSTRRPTSSIAAESGTMMTQPRHRRRTTAPRPRY